jgi:hypothetical protein
MEKVQANWKEPYTENQRGTAAKKRGSEALLSPGEEREASVPGGGGNVIPYLSLAISVARWWCVWGGVKALQLLRLCAPIYN